MKGVFFVVVLFFSLRLCAQQEYDPSADNIPDDTTNFSVTLPQLRLPNSLYTSIIVIDERDDTTNLGYIEPPNKTNIIIRAKKPLGEQFAYLLNGINDSSAHNGNLLLQVQRFSFSSFEGRYKHQAYCSLRLRLYAQTASGYQRLAFLDTTLTVRFGTIFNSSFVKRAFKSCNEVLVSFLSNNLKQPPALRPGYNLREVMHIDSIEKRSVPVYNVNTFKNGLYPTFLTFKNQQPDTFTKYSVVIKKGNITALQRTFMYTDENGDRNEIMADIDLNTFYALVYNGKAYAVNSYGLYPIEKRNDDFYFIGKINVEKYASDGAYAAAFIGSKMLLGIGSIGGLIADIATSGNAKAKFEIKIDYLSGGFIPIRKIDN